MELCCVLIQITCLVLLLLRNVCSLTGLGVCSRIQSHAHGATTLYYTDRFCCSGFEPDGSSRCKECQIGYESNGSKCIPCSKGHYGLKCVSKCSCQSQSICDRVHGCIPTTTVISPAVKNGDSKSTTEANTAQKTHRYVIVYMCSIAGTGFLLVTLGKIWKLRRGKIRSKKDEKLLFRFPNTTKWNVIHKKSIELQCNVYDYIDEKAMIKTLDDTCK